MPSRRDFIKQGSLLTAGFFVSKDEFFKKKGIRDKVEITYTTPMSGAFTKPVATKLLSSLLEEKQIHVSTDFYVEGVEEDRNTLKSYDGHEVDFDTLVVVPVIFTLFASSGVKRKHRKNKKAVLAQHNATV